MLLEQFPMEFVALVWLLVPSDDESSSWNWKIWQRLWISKSIYIYKYKCNTIYIYIYAHLPWSTPMIPNEGVTLFSPWPTFDHYARPFWCSLLIKRLMSLWRCRNKHWQDGKKQVFKAFDLQKNGVTRKCCLQVTICLEDKILPWIRSNILARKLDCVERCNTPFNSSAFLSFFLFFFLERFHFFKIIALKTRYSLK